MLRNVAKVLLLVSMTFFALNSFAGARDGGGGMGVRCDGPGWTSLEFLDHQEAILSGLQIDHDPKNQKEAVDLVVKLFAKHFWNPDTTPLAEYENSLKAIVKPIFQGRSFPNYETKKMEKVEYVKSLALSSDVGTYHIRPGCSLEQIAYYSDVNQELQIVKSRWRALTWLYKAMLVTHELVYLVNRRDGIESFRAGNENITSNQTREFVGKLFSTQGLASHSEGLPPPEKIIACTNLSDGESTRAVTRAYAYTTSENKLRLVFNAIEGLQSPYQVFADFNLGGPDELTSDHFTLTTPAALASATFRSAGELKFNGGPDFSGYKVILSKNEDSYVHISVVDWLGGKPLSVSHDPGVETLICRPLKN